MRKIIVHSHSSSNHGNLSNVLNPDTIYVDSKTNISYQKRVTNGNATLSRYFDIAAGSNVTINNTPDNDPNPSLGIINASAGSAFAGFTEVNIDADNSSLNDPYKPIYVISAADDCKIVINNGGYVQFPPTSTLTKSFVMIYVNKGYTDMMQCGNHQSSPNYNNTQIKDAINGLVDDRSATTQDYIDKKAMTFSTIDGVDDDDNVYLVVYCSGLPRYNVICLGAAY